MVLEVLGVFLEVVRLLVYVLGMKKCRDASVSIEKRWQSDRNHQNPLDLCVKAKIMIPK